MVVEFVPGGSLDKILRGSRIPPGTEDANYVNIWSRLTERELLQIALDVSNGMRHLESKLVSDACSVVPQYQQALGKSLIFLLTLKVYFLLFH